MKAHHLNRWWTSNQCRNRFHIFNKMITFCTFNIYFPTLNKFISYYLFHILLHILKNNLRKFFMTLCYSFRTIGHKKNNNFDSLLNKYDMCLVMKFLNLHMTSKLYQHVPFSRETVFNQ